MTAEQLLTEAGLQDNHWGLRIIQAEKNADQFTIQDRMDARKWPTCACGTQDPRIPRDVIGVPLDRELFNPGVQFYDNVGNDRPLAAAKNLIAIEKRAGEILASLPSKEGR